MNDVGQVVAWDWAGMNVYDRHFYPLIEPFAGQTIVLADWGFRDRKGAPDHLKLCPRGRWNERMEIETALSMVTVVCGLKRLRHRVAAYLTARLAFVTAMFNVLLRLFHKLHPEVDPFRMSIAEFSL